MIRIIDVSLAIIGLVILCPFIILIFLIGFVDTSSPIYAQMRVGLDKKPFYLYKFRTMYIGTPTVATHLVDKSSITKWGNFLRKTKLDEIPQLVNVLFGHMSFVGPRPSLFNQHELINERAKMGLLSIRPGITGLAQIKKIDMTNPLLLAQTDYEMASKLNVFTYFKYIFLTLLGKGISN